MVSYKLLSLRYTRYTLQCKIDACCVFSVCMSQIRGNAMLPIFSLSVGRGSE